MNRGRAGGRLPAISRERWWSSGQSMVELAIAVPVLALLLVAASDFARVFYISIAVNNAARAGAQYGSETYTNAANKNNAMQTEGCNDYGITAAPTCTGSQCTCGQLTLNASQCTCEAPPAGSTIKSCTAAPFSMPASYCTNNNNTATFVVVNTSATYTTILNYPGVQHSYTLTSKAIMQVEE